MDKGVLDHKFYVYIESKLDVSLTYETSSTKDGTIGGINQTIPAAPKPPLKPFITNVFTAQSNYPSFKMNGAATYQVSGSSKKDLTISYDVSYGQKKAGITSSVCAVTKTQWAGDGSLDHPYSVTFTIEAKA